MLGTCLSPPSLRETISRPSPTSRRSWPSSVLDVLERCEATAMVYGGGLWLAASTRTHLGTYACGRRPVLDASLVTIIEDTERAARMSSLEGHDQFSRSAIARWHDKNGEPLRSLPNEYAQVELVSGGEVSGALRVYRAAGGASESCNWEAVESVMCAAAPHIVLSLKREAEANAIDPMTGLCTPNELVARLDKEVERARMFPLELALVMLELRLGPDRQPGMLSESELKAVGGVLVKTLRASDSAGRMPDGRFAVLLPMTSQRNALIAASRIADELAACGELSGHVLCQTGISGWSFEGPGADELLQQANHALEEARSAGACGAFVFI